MEYQLQAVPSTSIGITVSILAMICWTLASVGYKFALGNQGTTKRDPIVFIGFRLIVVCITFLPLTLIFGEIQNIFMVDVNTGIKYWVYALLAGLSCLLGDICYFSALSFVDSSRVYPLLNIQMLITYPLAYYIFGESIPGTMLIAATLIIIGVLFIGDRKHVSVDKGLENHSEDEKQKIQIKGIILGLGTGVFFALGFIFQALQVRTIDGTIESNFARLLCYLSLTWIVIFISKRPIPKKSDPHYKELRKAYALAGLFGLISAGIGDWIYQIGIQNIGSAKAITIVSSAPLLNQIFAIIFLKEKFRPRFLIGVILIIVANLII